MSLADTMWAARIRAREQVALERVPIPEPAPDEVRFRVKGTGVCASNLGPWFGLPWTQYPLGAGESGHEAWGVVHAVGRNVRGIAVGDAIAAVSNAAYAEYDIARSDSVVRLPEALEDRPFPAEPLGCAMNIFARSGIMAGHTVAIVGAGFLGAVLTRLAAARGARVLAISRRPTSLALARELGASETIPLDDHSGIIRRVGELTQGVFCDRVIEATGKQWPLDLAAELTRVRGRLVIAGYHQDGARSVNMQLWNWRGLDVVNAHEREPARYVHGMQQAIAAVLDGTLAPQRLFTHSYPLERLGDALAATAERPDGFVKALVVP
jgi:threonine dehydrogenase-like Zn-dependent dehydrogenase